MNEVLCMVAATIVVVILEHFFYGSETKMRTTYVRLGSKKGMLFEPKKAKLLLCLFREQQSKHGNIGCQCSECQKDMAIALSEFNKQFPIFVFKSKKTASESK